MKEEKVKFQRSGEGKQTHMVSLQHFVVLLESKTHFALIEGTKRITVHFYLQARHEGNVGVGVLL